MDNVKSFQNRLFPFLLLISLIVCLFSLSSKTTYGSSQDLTPLTQEDWRLHFVDSEHTTGEDGKATNAFDGDKNTYWHTKHSPIEELPHEIQIDLGGIHEIGGFSYLPRQINGANGTIKEYEFYVSVDGKNWGKPVAKGEFKNSIQEKEILFDQEVIAKYVRFVALSEVKGQQFTSLAELNVLQTKNNVETNKTLEVNTSSASLAIGETEQLKVTWEFGSIQKDVSDIVKYASLNSEVATVSGSGLIVGRGKGETKIRIEDGTAKPVELAVSVSGGKEKHEITVEEKDDILTIQNWYMARSYDISDRQLKPKEIENKRSGQIANVALGEEFVIHLEKDRVINASELTLASWEEVDSDTADKTLKFTFKRKENVKVTLFVEMNATEHFMRKYIEIDSADSELHVSKIDLESVQVPGPLWSSPQSGLQGSGQPVYANDLFFGVEFAGANNQTSNQSVVTSYALGNPKVGKGVMQSKMSVAGAAPKQEEIRAGFLAYVDTIALAPRFQLQYNPWFELYHDADSKSLIQTYKDIEKSMSSYGVRPFDIYAADDGWMDYKKGFWDFNATTFPNEFIDVKNTLQHFNSKFGVWLGPTGGYKEPGAFAQHLNKEYGYPILNGRVDAADPGYTSKLKERMMGLTEVYDVNYWKLDGFLFGDFSQDYITRFFDTWIDIFQDLREHDKETFLNMTTGSNNSPWLLPYVNSIWLNIGTDAGYRGTGSDRDQMLTYVDDKYYERFKVMQSQMPLRFIYNHEPVHGIHVKNPAGRDYTQTNEEWRKYLFMSLLRGSGFVELYYSPSLFDDAQWTINADALTWTEENFDALSNVEMFGGNPVAGDVYGYSGWTNEKGIIGFRNPSSEVKSYEISLDSLMGLKDKQQTYHRKTVYPYGASEDGPYKYGETIKVTLEPHEAYIWQFESNSDMEAPQIEQVKAESKQEIQVSFNERIERSSAENPTNYTVDNGVIVEKASLGEDYSSVTLTVSEMEKGVDYKLTVNNIKDMANNAIAKTSEDLVLHDQGLVAHWKPSNKEGELAIDGTGNKNDATIHHVENEQFNGTSSYLDGGLAPSVKGEGDIAISAKVKTTGNKDQMIIQQGSEEAGSQYQLKVNKDGYVEWMTGTDSEGFKAVSETKVNDGKWHDIVAVREVNGHGKIYIDEELVGSDYKETENRKGIKADLKQAIVLVGKNYNDGQYFEGEMSEIRIYNRGISYDTVGELPGDYEQSAPKVISQEKWRVHYISSEETSGEPGTGVAKDAFDGKSGTFWHTQYKPSMKGYPHELQIDLGDIYEMNGFRYLPRQAMNGNKFANGIIKDFEFYVSADGENWGDPVANGTFAEDNKEKEVLFDQTKGRYIRIVALSEIYGQEYAHIAELNVLQASGEDIPEKDVTAENMKKLVEQLEASGEIAEARTVQSFKVHLTAVALYEKQEAAGKVVKHMESFKQLLDHQKENELISNKAYDLLKADTDSLIKKWK